MMMMIIIRVGLMKVCFTFFLISLVHLWGCLYSEKMETKMHTRLRLKSQFRVMDTVYSSFLRH